MLKFNFQYIKNLASPGVWRRGYDYYQKKQVEKVELCEEGILGKVKGNFRDEYTTILNLSEKEVKPNCDCPFPDEWCKHAVAVALIGISDGLWDKYWGIEEEVEQDQAEYAGNYKIVFSEKSKPKTVLIKVLDRKKNEYVTEVEQLLRSVVEAQKQNLIELNEEEKKEFYLLNFLYKYGQLDKKKKQFFVPFNNLDELMACLSVVEDLRHAQGSQRMRVETNPLKLIMAINISMIGNVLVALHWKRVNPEDIIPYEEVRLFAKRVQWGLYQNTLFPIETKVGELPYFLSKSSFLDIRGSDGGKFLFQQLPKFKESLEGELEIEESELVKNARLEENQPKKVLTIEMPDEATLRVALEFDYDGMRVPYTGSSQESPYVCVVKNAPPPKQYSIEEFREQEAAKKKADIEAGLIDPSEIEKKKVKVIRVKVLKEKLAGKSKKVAAAKTDDKANVKDKAPEKESEIVKTEGEVKFNFSAEPLIIPNEYDFTDYDEFDVPQPESRKLEEVKEPEIETEIIQEPEEKVELKPEISVIANEEDFFDYEESDDDEVEKYPVSPLVETETVIEEVKKVTKPKEKLASFDDLVSDLVPAQTHILFQNMTKKKTQGAKRHKQVEDLDIMDKILFGSSAKPAKPSSKPATKSTTKKDKEENEPEKPKKRKGRPPKKVNMDSDSIEETIITEEDIEESDETSEDKSEAQPAGKPEDIYWAKRNMELEKQTYKELLAASLTPVQTNKLEALGDNVVDFVGKFFPLLKENDEWILEYPPELERIRLADEPARFKVKIGFEEKQNTFILDVVCRVGKREIPLDEVQELLKDGRKYVYASGSGYAEIPLAESLQLTKTLNSFDANKIGDSKFRAFTYKVGLIAELYDQNVEVEMTEEFQKFWDLISSFSDYEELEIPGNVNVDLREYQKKGYTWLYFLYTYGLNGILADDMGLGKTVQSLTLLQKAKNEQDRKPSLVVCPTSVVFNWEEEIKKFAPDLKFITFTGSTRHSLLNKVNSNDVVITSYALLRRDINQLRKFDFRYIILDESQKIKNYQSLTANVTKQLRSNHRLALSGTPIENRLSELWSVFDFLMPNFLYDYNEFRYRYAQPIEDHNNKDAERRLKKQVYPFILRRLKQNVAKDLPDKLEFLSYCELLPEQQDIYIDILDQTREEIFSKIERDGFAKSQMSILSALLRLRQICCHPKLIGDIHESQIRISGKFEHLKDMIVDVIDQGHRVLLFSQFVQMLNIIKDYLDREGIRYEYLTGSTKNRKECVDRFNNDSRIPIFLISLKAGGTGLNLTGADYVIHYDPWWNPAVEDQATDRAHRIGQTKKVFVYRLITKGTVEEKMIKLQEKKRDLIDSVITVDTSLGKILTYEDLKDILTPGF